MQMERQSGIHAIALTRRGHILPEGHHLVLRELCCIQILLKDFSGASQLELMMVDKELSIRTV